MAPDMRPVIVAAARTPIATAGGALAQVPVEGLAAPVLSSLYDSLADLDSELLDVVLGNCMGPGGNVARLCSLQAGLGEKIPAVTVDRQCASGLAAILLGAGELLMAPGAVIAGGVESASTAPVRTWPKGHVREGQVYERAPFAPDGWPDPDMGVAADLLADIRGISRERQDAYASRSHARARKAQELGHFSHEIVRVEGMSRDDRPRVSFTPDRLSRFPAAFREGGTVTAANSCGINDGCAAVAIVDGATASRLGVTGLRIVSSAVTGVDPGQPALGLVPAAEAAVRHAGLTFDEVDVIEFNEAFAVQMLACADDLGIDDSRICEEGGALALGRPWGASGAVIMVRLFHRMVTREAGRYGLAAIASGGGQGVAVVVELCR